LHTPIQTLNVADRPTGLHEPRSAARPIGFYPADTIQAMSELQTSDDGVKYLTTGNWLEPDPICLKFGGLNLATREHCAPTGERWAERFLGIDLASTVPSEVREMWEAARGLLLYGWFSTRSTRSANTSYGASPITSKSLCGLGFWRCRRRDSNPRHADYDSAALTS
jgi:hypothetical protein